MDSFNVHDAKTHFSRILARVQAGEAVIITKAGQPIARIVPVRTIAPRQPDTEQGRLLVTEDFDAPLPDDLQRAFQGRA